MQKHFETLRPLLFYPKNTLPAASDHAGCCHGHGLGLHLLLRQFHLPPFPDSIGHAEQFSYDGKVYIFGGGHLAQELVPVLSHLGFRCIVSDDREEFTKPELFPGAEEIRLIDFGKLEETFTIHPEDYIVVVTRGHLCDTDAERFGLKTPAGYIGVVGSRKKTKFVTDKLLAEGFTEEQLARVTAPIGIEIGSETPAEIAISIAAQLIEVRSKKK